MRLTESGSKRFNSRASVVGAPGSHRPNDQPNQPSTSAAVRPPATWSARVSDPWRLASRSPSGPEHEGHVGVGRSLHSQQPSHPELTGGGVEQVVAPHHLADPLLVVVDHHHQVVGRRPVSPPNDEVIDDPSHGASHAIDEGDDLALGPHPQRGTPTGRLPCVPVRVAQVAAGARVGVGLSRAVRGGHRCVHFRQDLSPGAVAGVGPPLGHELVHRLRVLRPPIRHPDDRPVVGETEGGQVGQRRRLVLRASGSEIEVVDAHDVPASVGPGEQPRQHRRAQVPEVQRPGGTRGESTVRHDGNGSPGGSPLTVTPASTSGG